MPAIHVCPLSWVATTVAISGASHLISLVDAGTMVARPPSIPADRHLFLGIADISGPTDGLLPPTRQHIERLIGFVGGWDRTRPMVVHCFAGISRSSAGAFIALCAGAPQRDEREIALALRRASPTACPNPLMVELADRILGRQGRMSEAVRVIGRGTEAFEAEPYILPVAG